MFHLLDGVVLMLAGPRIEDAVMIEAHPSEVILHAIATIAIKMRYLAVLFGQVAGEVETERATPGAFGQNGR
jgi:hypothetical protein